MPPTRGPCRTQCSLQFWFFSLLSHSLLHSLGSFLSVRPTYCICLDQQFVSIWEPQTCLRLWWQLWTLSPLSPNVHGHRYVYKLLDGAETRTPQIKDLCFKTFDLNSSSASVASHPFPSEAFFYQCFSPSCHSFVCSFTHSLVHLLTCTPIILLGTKD